MKMTSLRGAFCATLAVLATGAACAQSSMHALGALTESTAGWNDGLMDKHVEELASPQACAVRVRGASANSAQLVHELVLRRREGGEVNVLARMRLFGAMPGERGDFDVAVPVDASVERITFGEPALTLWTRADSACLPRP